METLDLADTPFVFIAGGTVVIQGEIAVMGPLPIGSAIQVQLQDSLEGALINADLDLGHTVFASNPADVRLGIVFPVFENLADVVVHHSISRTGACSGSRPATLTPHRICGQPPVSYGS